MKNTYGTGGFLLMNVGGDPRPSENRLITTAAWKLGCAPTQYALEGSVFIAGAVVQWLRDQMGFIESASEIEALAREVPDSGGVWFVPAFVGLGAPYWDPDARGMLIGLTRGTNRAHIARAALEAIAFQSAEVLTLWPRMQHAQCGNFALMGAQQEMISSCRCRLTLPASLLFDRLRRKRRH